MAQKKAGGKPAKTNTGNLPMPAGDRYPKSGKTPKKGNKGQGKKAK